MLVLTRKKNESIIIREDIEISILEIGQNQVKVGISAPRDMNIYRKEVYIAIKDENKKAAQSFHNLDRNEVLKELFKIQ